MAKRTIVVTGAASGIGAATLSALEARGHRCIAVDRNAVAAREALRCDLSDQDSIMACCQAIDGPIDAIAHVAGISGTQAASVVFRVNYLGARRFIETLLPKLSDGSSVVMVASLAARRCQWEPSRLRSILALSDWNAALAAIDMDGIGGGAAYEISKRLILAWLPHATAAAAARRIRFNVVTPGPVETPLLPGFRESMGVERLEAARVAIGRYACPEEIAAPILFLLDPAASWINGVEIVADGGLVALREAASG
jgi:NAD(P)-dependent dehydrogenase (short-subunit alcohol dehydrogenase family)